MPCAVTAAWSARPSPAIAGTTTHLVAGPQHAPQGLAALLERDVAAATAVEVEDVEHEVARPAGPACR